MFDPARLLGSGTYRAMLVPDEAIVTDQTRRLVYVVGKDGKVSTQRIVETGAKVEGLRIVRAGLAPTRPRHPRWHRPPPARRAGDTQAHQHTPRASKNSPPPKPRRSKNTASRRPGDGAVRHDEVSPLLHRAADLRGRAFGPDRDRRGVAYPTLPVAQYPDIAPPTVVVKATFPGASAETLAETVAAPLKTGDQRSRRHDLHVLLLLQDGNGLGPVSFKQGTDVDQAQVLVQNRVTSAEPRLPEEVRRIGVKVEHELRPTYCSSFSFGSRPTIRSISVYRSNYVNLQVLDRMAR